MDTGLAALIAATLATLGWLYSNRNTRLIDRRKHTYEVFRGYKDRDEHQKSLEHVRKLIAFGSLPHPSSADPESKADLDHLERLLNHYEFIAAAIWCGDIDERLIRSCEYSTIVKLADRSATFIAASRDARAQPTMYENLEHIARRWKTRENNRDAIREFFLMRPARDWDSASMPEPTSPNALTNIAVPPLELRPRRD